MDFVGDLEIEVNLESLGENKTEMTLIHRGFKDDQMIEQTRQGWQESFDKLENFVTQ